MGESRALVTGATGFLGSHLCRELDSRDWPISGTKRVDSDVSRLTDTDIDWLEADVLDREAVQTAVTDHDIVFHLAGATLQSADASTVRRVNVEGTRNVLEASLDAGVERVVFTSTAGTRRSDGVANEEDVAEPIGAYQASKAAGEDLVHQYTDRGLDAVIVHPGMVFGPGDRNFTARLITLVRDPKMFAYLPGGASFVSAHDVADGILAAATRGKPGEHYLLGGENLTFGEALSIIAKRATGYKPLLRLPAPLIHAMGPVAEAINTRLGTRVFPFNREMAYLATQEHFYSSVKAREELGYRYEPLRDHVDSALRWYRTA